MKKRVHTGGNQQECGAGVHNSTRVIEESSVIPVGKSLVDTPVFACLSRTRELGRNDPRDRGEHTGEVEVIGT